MIGNSDANVLADNKVTDNTVPARLAGLPRPGYNEPSVGIFLIQTATQGDTDNNTITKNIVLNNGADGIHIAAQLSVGGRDGATGNVIEHNLVEGHTGHGIMLRGIDAASGADRPANSNTISHNTVCANPGNGISVASFSNSITANQAGDTLPKHHVGGLAGNCRPNGPTPGWDLYDDTSGCGDLLTPPQSNMWRNNTFSSRSQVATPENPDCIGGIVPESLPPIARTGVASISPRSGASGCEVVTVLGNGFDGATRVAFGDSPAAFEVKSGSEITATAPPHDPGPVDVVVTSPAGTSLVTADTTFTFDNVATVDSLTPPSGQSHGGTEVVIKGLGLCDVTGVSFGTEAAATFRLDSPTQITAITPAHAPGVVEVAVHKAGGASPTSAGSVFRFFEGDWSPTAEMTEGVWSHTANLIAGSGCGEACGKALVAGGMARINQTVPRETDISQLYDPMTGSWERTGGLGTARTQHTATTLSSGDVLIVGGLRVVNPTTFAQEAAIGTAERYDASEGTWVPAGAIEPRIGHTATLLADGRVLVTGGRTVASSQSTVGRTLASAQLYDPDTGTWSAAADMPAARSGHTATLLRDGSVLVVGGGIDALASPSQLYRSAEIYRPEPDGPGRWIATGAMSTGRIGHTATLLGDGKVLVAGGDDGQVARPRTAEVFDPSSFDADGVKGRWALTGSMTRFHIGHTATRLPNGHVLVAGSRPRFPDSDASPESEAYDPISATWYPVDPMGSARSDGAATLLPDGSLLVSGGLQHDGGGSELALDDAELFAHREGRTPAIFGLAPPVGSTLGGTVVTISGLGLFPARQVLFGGVPVEIKSATDKQVVVVAPPRPQGTVDVTVTTLSGSSPLSNSTSFTYTDGVWSATSPLADPRYRHTMTLLDPPLCRVANPPENYPCGKVLATGGTSDFGASTGYASAELYDPSTGTWKKTEAMSVPRFDHTATLLNDGRVLVAGGRSEGLETSEAFATSEIYNPTTGLWDDEQGSLLAGRFSHTATLLKSGEVLITGGTFVEFNRPSLASSELFSPSTGEWMPATPMAQGRQLHTATLLPSGAVLVAGGFEGGSNSSAPTPNSRPLNSTEIFTPSSGIWLPAGSLGVARYGHTATLLSTGRCGTNCNNVMVAGGFQGHDQKLGLASSEVFDVPSSTWTPNVPDTPRGGHSATALADGSVLIAGRASPFTVSNVPVIATDAAERFDPSTAKWRRAPSMISERGLHEAVLLDGPACRASQPPEYCGSALVAGGALSGQGNNAPATASAELYTPAPTVSAVVPSTGPSLGGTEVVVTGTGFAKTSTVTFGGVPATGVTVVSPSRLTVIAPRHAPGPVEVGVVNTAGTSAHEPPRLDHPFTYTVSSVPGQVTGLVAAAVSDSQVVLSFRAPSSDGNFPDASPPAERFVVKQSATAFTDEASIEAAPSICKPAGCAFTPPTVGAVLSLDVGDLEPDTTYYYAVMAVNETGPGPVSSAASATTHPLAPAAPVCSAVNAASGQVTYPKGYSLVGLPGGTVINSWSPLYGWFDQGAGGGYSLDASSAPVSAGRGYWAWFACPSLVDLGEGSDSVRFDLGAYRASMVGNPSSTSPALLAGHDFVARWDPGLNKGAGGYGISSYREPQTLDVGEGVWAFNYAQNQIRIEVTR